MTARSAAKLKGVHPDLVRVVERAWALGAKFVVTEGLRSLARQRELVAARASRTLNSRHLTGHAVDLAVVVGGRVRWDWPLYARLAAVMRQAAAIEKVPLRWGGDWDGDGSSEDESFRDGPHFELPREAYPATPRSREARRQAPAIR